MGLTCARPDQLLLRVILEHAQRRQCPTVELSTIKELLDRTMLGSEIIMDEGIRNNEELNLIKVDEAAGVVTITTTGCLMAGPYDLPEEIAEEMGPSTPG